MYIPNGNVIEVNITDMVFIKEVIIDVARTIGAKSKYYNCYGIGMVPQTTNEVNFKLFIARALINKKRLFLQIYYLHPDLSIDEMEQKFSMINSWDQCKFMTIVRFVPLNFNKFYKEDAVTFSLYYYQVSNL